MKNIYYHQNLKKMLAQRLDGIELNRKLLKPGYYCDEYYLSYDLDEILDDVVQCMKFIISYRREIYKIFTVNCERFYDYEKKYIRIKKLERIIYESQDD